MRKTLVVLAVVTSVLLLQGPAWAPNLYVTQVDDTESGATRTVDVISTTCTSKMLRVTFKWGEVAAKTTSATGKYRHTLSQVPSSAGTVDEGDVRKATCAGTVLALTGTASIRLLALGLSLLVIGALLVLTGQRRPLLRRG